MLNTDEVHVMQVSIQHLVLQIIIATVFKVCILQFNIISKMYICNV